MRRIRVVRQRDAMQCGVACLSMICGWHGEQLAVDTLERVCRPTADGVSLSGIAQAAEKLGMETGAGLANHRLALASLDSPCVLHWNQNHFVVLERADRRARRFPHRRTRQGKAVDGPRGVRVSLDLGPQGTRSIRAA